MTGSFFRSPRSDYTSPRSVERSIRRYIARYLLDEDPEDLVFEIIGVTEKGDMHSNIWRDYIGSGRYCVLENIIDEVGVEGLEVLQKVSLAKMEDKIRQI